MNSYRYQQKPTMTRYGTKIQRRVLVALCAMLVLTVIGLTVWGLDQSTTISRTQDRLERRINSSLIDAINEVSRLTGGVQSNTSSKLALVRQYVFNIDQMNNIAIEVFGESGRIVPTEAITALYNDLDIYETTIQTATSSTLDIRTTTLTHLTALQTILAR
ncbi:MAG: hypothetical protein PHP02_04340 [Eubacteriales bacterium]|nr:hypothetical protein [Eubacteriales bacterium]